MPIDVHADLRAPTEEEFAAIAYEVMASAFEVHNHIGRFFDGRIYKYLVGEKLGSAAELEIPIDVRFGTFRKRYYLDMLVHRAAVFEWKAADRLAPEHRAQCESCEVTGKYKLPVLSSCQSSSCPINGSLADCSFGLRYDDVISNSIRRGNIDEQDLDRNWRCNGDAGYDVSVLSPTRSGLRTNRHCTGKASLSTGIT